MVKEKRKNGSFTRLLLQMLILLWSASYAVGFEALWQTQQHLQYDLYKITLIAQIFHHWNFASYFIFFVLVIPALIQMRLVKRVLQGSARGWISLTLVGVMISWLILHLKPEIVSGASQYEDSTFWRFGFIVFTPVALIQMIWLVQNVKRAWLWVIASLVGTHFFSSTILNRGGSLPVFVLAGALYGLIMGSTMFYLLGLSLG